MTQLNRNYEYTEDIKRIKKAALEFGKVLSDENAVELWEDYSDRFAAGWLVLPKDDLDLYTILKDLRDEVKPVQNFYQDTFTAPELVVQQAKAARKAYVKSEYKTVRQFFIEMYQINKDGNFELFEHGFTTSKLYYGDLIDWLNVDDDNVDDQEDWYENKPQQSYSEKASYREWCFIKYLFGEIQILPEIS